MYLKDFIVENWIFVEKNEKLCCISNEYIKFAPLFTKKKILDMIKEIYQQPTIEIEVMACEQGYSLSSDFAVPDGGNNGSDDYWAD